MYIVKLKLFVLYIHFKIKVSTMTKKNMLRTKNIRFTDEMLEEIDLYRGAMSFSAFMKLSAKTLIKLKKQKMEQEVVSSNQLENLEKICKDEIEIRDEKNRDEKIEIDELLSEYPEEITVDNKGSKVKVADLYSLINKYMDKNDL